MSAAMEKDLPAQLTPQQRLAKSREAISVLLGNDPDRHEADKAGAASIQSITGEKAKTGSKRRSSWWPVFTSLAKTWWHRHPLNAVAHMAEPVIAAYAKREPLKLLGAAALVGAVIVVVRPWRLISAGAQLAAALRPSEISAFATTMLATFNSTLQKDKEERESRRNGQATDR